MRRGNPETAYFDIVKRNFTTYKDLEILPKPVQGQALAGARADVHEEKLTEAEKAQGIHWYHRPAKKDRTPPAKKQKSGTPKG
ncbi:MAG TPA: hypothetical protein VKU44_05510 [Terriglobia bacterium]|nr:hypothetical protein [Terriglobia bacterium]